MDKGTEFEISSLGIRVDTPVVDWATGQVLLQQGQWYVPNQTDYATFGHIVNPAARVPGWAKRYVSDMRVVVMLMCEWFEKFGQ